MKNVETGCFGICARMVCIIAGPEDLNAEAVRLAVTIKKIFKELGF